MFITGQANAWNLEKNTAYYFEAVLEKEKLSEVLNSPYLLWFGLGKKLPDWVKETYNAQSYEPDAKPDTFFYVFKNSLWYVTKVPMMVCKSTHKNTEEIYVDWVSTLQPGQVFNGKNFIISTEIEEVEGIPLVFGVQSWKHGSVPPQWKIVDANVSPKQYRQITVKGDNIIPYRVSVVL